ncbi:MAG TPA: hypothetical protein VE684_01875 [Crenalkalicoccus sp.]|jgi:hypothetical protein|nr:hypothetical protein [Crenalkalicoccus sp.]
MRKRARPTISEAELAAAVEQVLADYRGFLAGTPPGADAGDAKAFATRHAAARSALAHLEQLLKIAGETGSENQVREITERMRETRAEIAALPPEETEPDDDGAG